MFGFAFAQIYLFNIIQITILKPSLRSSMPGSYKDPSCHYPGGQTCDLDFAVSWRGQRALSVSRQAGLFSQVLSNFFFAGCTVVFTNVKVAEYCSHFINEGLKIQRDAVICLRLITRA